MNTIRLIDLIRSGESSTLEFKRDGLRGAELAKELVAFLNLEGGTVLIGVEDDGSISGTTHDRHHRIEEWVAEVCRAKVEPPIVPLLSWTRDIEPGRDVLAVTVTLGPDKPYAHLYGDRRTCYIRMGSTSREVTRKELVRMYRPSGRLRYGFKPVPGADLDALDRRRLVDYVTRVLGGDAPADDDLGEWETLLRNIGLMTISAERHVATVDGLLLFGKLPARFMPQSGIRAVCFPGTDPSDESRADEDLRGPMVPLGAEDDSLVEPSLVDQAWDFVQRNTTPTTCPEDRHKVVRRQYPEEVVREAALNALIHRDYSITGAKVTLAIHTDRMEIVSPRHLPNTVTLEGVKAGVRYARNQTLVNIMRDYSYVDTRGMGIRNKIIPGMGTHNGTEPDLIEEDSRFAVRLWRSAKLA